MSRFDGDRLDDITAAIEAIRSHVARGPLSDDLVSDAIRIRLLEIGEAVKSLSDELTASEPEIPWKQIARMRDHLAHRYFMTELEIIRDTVALRVPAAPSQEYLLSALPIAGPTGSNGKSFTTIVAINQAAQRYRPEILRPTRVPMAQCNSAARCHRVLIKSSSLLPRGWSPT